MFLNTKNLIMFIFLFFLHFKNIIPKEYLIILDIFVVWIVLPLFSVLVVVYIFVLPPFPPPSPPSQRILQS